MNQTEKNERREREAREDGVRYVHNPVRAGFYPDPSVCRAGDAYYCVHSSFGYAPGIPVFRSYDLAGWEQIGHVLTRKEQLKLEGAEVSGGIYAPTIRYHEGIFYVVVTNMSHGGNFYVTAERPEGPWSDPYYLEGAQGIDPSLYFEGDRCYYVGQRQKGDAAYFGDCEIWIQELDLKRHCLTGEAHSVWDGAMKRTWWPEGPHLYRKDGYYYLLIAEGGTEYNHSISVARSRTVYGPYEGCPANPVFTHRHLGRRAPVQNAGHGDLIDTPQGDWYILMLATRPLQGCAELGRETFLAEVAWEEGWPVINAGEGRLREWQAVRTAEASATARKAGSCGNEGRPGGPETQDAAAPETQHPTCTETEDGICAKAEHRGCTEAEDGMCPEAENAACVQAAEKRLRPETIRWQRPLDLRLAGLREFLPDTQEDRCRMEEGRLYLKADPAGLADPGVPSFLCVRMESREFDFSTELDAGLLGEGEKAGIACFYDESNHLVLEVTRREGALRVACGRIEKGVREDLGGLSASGKPGEEKLCLRVRGSGQQAELWAGERRLAKEVSLAFLSSEAAGGFTGCMLGVFAQGQGGTAVFGGLNVRQATGCTWPGTATACSPS